MTPDDGALVPVTQTDRDAATAIYNELIVDLQKRGVAAEIRETVSPHDDQMVQAFARHRIAASPAQVASAPDRAWVDVSGPLVALRAACNDEIRKINTGAGVNTPGFRSINRLLKACDAVFALSATPSPSDRVTLDGAVNLS